MPYLFNHFDLKPGVKRAQFDQAWAAFAEYLITAGLAQSVGPVLTRHADSGFDTDGARTQSGAAIIGFRDQAQADAAWAAIEAEVAPLAGLHRAVFRLVQDAVFTFWDDQSNT